MKRRDILKAIGMATIVPSIGLPEIKLRTDKPLKEDICNPVGLYVGDELVAVSDEETTLEIEDNDIRRTVTLEGEFLGEQQELLSFMKAGAKIEYRFSSGDYYEYSGDGYITDWAPKPNKNVQLRIIGELYRVY